MLFAADAASLAGSRLMQIKIALVVLALANAVLFRAALEPATRQAGTRRRRRSGGCRRRPRSGCGSASGYCGRMIAYL